MFDKRQYGILSERYFESLLGDLTALLWMVGQAPIIAAIIVLRWKSLQATESLYFVIALSSVWFGCINSCREIAKEIPIYKRELLFGLDSGAYLASKVKILGLVGLVETGLFFFILNHWLDLDIALVPGFIGAYGLYFTGMSLGLLISRWSGSVSKAVISVPVAIIPQIVFSKFVLPETTLKGIGAKIDKIMPAKWGFEAIKACEKPEVQWGDYASSLFVLVGIGLLFLLLTFFHLWFVKEDL